MVKDDNCIFNCEVCGNQTQASEETRPAPACCDQPMVKQEPLPVCETSATAEHSRYDDFSEPCDDGRAGK